MRIFVLWQIHCRGTAACALAIGKIIFRNHLNSWFISAPVVLDPRLLAKVGDLKPRDCFKTLIFSAFQAFVAEKKCSQIGV